MRFSVCYRLEGIDYTAKDKQRFRNLLGLGEETCAGKRLGRKNMLLVCRKDNVCEGRVQRELTALRNDNDMAGGRDIEK